MAAVARAVCCAPIAARVHSDLVAVRQAVHMTRFRVLCSLARRRCEPTLGGVIILDSHALRAALVVVGDARGTAGFGYGKALLAPQAVQKATRDAEKCKRRVLLCDWLSSLYRSHKPCCAYDSHVLCSDDC